MRGLSAAQRDAKSGPAAAEQGARGAMPIRRPGWMPADEMRSIQSFVSRRLAGRSDEAALAKASRELREKGRAAAGADPDEEEDEEDDARPAAAPQALGEAAPIFSPHPPAAAAARLPNGQPLLEYRSSIGGRRAPASEGDSTMALQQPSCVIALPNGDICVADTGSHRLLLVAVDRTASGPSMTMCVRATPRRTCTPPRPPPSAAFNLSSPPCPPPSPPGAAGTRSSLSAQRALHCTPFHCLAAVQTWCTQWRQRCRWQWRQQLATTAARAGVRWERAIRVRGWG